MRFLILSLKSCHNHDVYDIQGSIGIRGLNTSQPSYKDKRKYEEPSFIRLSFPRVSIECGRYHQWAPKRAHSLSPLFLFNINQALLCSLLIRYPSGPLTYQRLPPSYRSAQPPRAFKSKIKFVTLQACCHGTNNATNIPL